MTTSACPRRAPAFDRLHASFLAILPRLEAHARAAFSGVRCSHRRDDHVAEVVAIAWHWFVRLARRGKDASRFPMALADFAARAVHNGRRLAGAEAPKDVLSPSARRSHDIAVHRLVEPNAPASGLVTEALRDNTRTPVPDQVSFRLDFPAWLRRRSRRDRRLVCALLRGGRTREVASQFGLTPSRVSQLRAELRADWARFTADPADPHENAPAPVPAG
jgi:hypothetical protein